MSDACSTHAASAAASSEPDSSRDDPGGATASDDPLPAESVSLSLSLDLNTEDVSPPIIGWLESRIQRAAALASASGELGVTLVGDPEMAELHGRCMGDPTPTDILTFDLRDEPASVEDRRVDGDLVIGVEEAARCAAQQGHETRVEVLLYAVHGLLHLLGEDDLTEADYIRMHRRENELLTALGFANVFGPIDGRDAHSPTPGSIDPGETEPQA